MNRKEIIDCLKNAYCNDACECLFNLYDHDDKHNGICKATDPPIDPWSNTDGCPLCKQIAKMLEQKEPKQAVFRPLPFNDYRFECPWCMNSVEMFQCGKQTSFCPICGQAITF